MHENFLATQSLATGSHWLNSNPITTKIEGGAPSFDDEEQPKKTSELLGFILQLLNPYFYGALILILIFSVTWSVRARFTHSDELSVRAVAPTVPPTQRRRQNPPQNRPSGRGVSILPAPRRENPYRL